MQVTIERERERERERESAGYHRERERESAGYHREREREREREKSATSHYHLVKYNLNQPFLSHVTRFGMSTGHRWVERESVSECCISAASDKEVEFTCVSIVSAAFTINNHSLSMEWWISKNFVIPIVTITLIFPWLLFKSIGVLSYTR